MFVKRTEITTKFELLMDIYLLITKDWTEIVSEADTSDKHDVQTTPRSATSRALVERSETVTQLEERPERTVRLSASR